MIGIQDEVTRQLAKEAREAKKEAGKLLDQHWKEDEQHWTALAKKYNIRIPQRHLPNTETKWLKRAINSVGGSLAEYLESCGATTVGQLTSMNPLMPAYAEVGFFLEWWDEQQ